MRLESSGDSVHEMMKTLVEAGYVSETGDSVNFHELAHSNALAY